MTQLIIVTVNFWFMHVAGPHASPIKLAACVITFHCLNISETITFTTVWSDPRTAMIVLSLALQSLVCVCLWVEYRIWNTEHFIDNRNPMSFCPIFVSSSCKKSTWWCVFTRWQFCDIFLLKFCWIRLDIVSNTNIHFDNVFLIYVAEDRIANQGPVGKYHQLKARRWRFSVVFEGILHSLSVCCEIAYIISAIAPFMEPIV